MNRFIYYDRSEINIGGKEVAARTMIGHAGLALSILCGLFFFFFKIPPPYRFLLFIPIFIAVIGYIQAAFRFCVALGYFGIFKLAGGEAKQGSTAEIRLSSRLRAIGLILYSIAISASLSLLFYEIR